MQWRAKEWLLLDYMKKTQEAGATEQRVHTRASRLSYLSYASSSVGSREQSSHPEGPGVPLEQQPIVGPMHPVLPEVQVVSSVCPVISTTSTMGPPALQSEVYSCSPEPSLFFFRDTAVSHAVSLIQSVGTLIHFLPPYSPDLNPIKGLSSKVKAVLRESDQAVQLIGEECATSSLLLSNS